MIRWIAKIYFRLKGWKVIGPWPADIPVCILTAAPHTSNWDFINAWFAFSILRVPWKFTIKKEWMKWPMRIFFKRMGAIPIDRKLRKENDVRGGMVEQMIGILKNTDRLVLLVTPEGTRSRREKWKTGFYHAAVGAGTPIVLGFLDYRKKEAGVGKIVHPTGNIATDMREIMDFYKDITPKYPEKFSVDKDYL